MQDSDWLNHTSKIYNVPSPGDCSCTTHPHERRSTNISSDGTSWQTTVPIISNLHLSAAPGVGARVCANELLPCALGLCVC